MVEITYFEVDYAPGRYFNCDKQRGTLSESSCAAQYKRHKNNCSGSICTGCEIGAIHAGEKVIYGLPEKMCCRCGGTDKRLIHARICVSCYNRERELNIGKNGKGKFPVNARLLRPVKVLVAQAGEIQTDSIAVADTAEAAMAQIRRNHKAAISFMPPGVPDYIFSIATAIGTNQASAEIT